MVGVNDETNLDKMEDLKVVKFLDLAIIVFDSDPSEFSRIVKVVEALNRPFICVRNKADNYNSCDNDHKTLAGWKKYDDDEIRKSISKQSLYKGLFYISAKNKMKNVGNLFDWEEFITFLSNF